MKNIRATVGDAMPDGKVRRLLAALVLSAVAIAMSGCAGGVKDTSRTFSAVVIDAGHGGHDNGASTRYSGREKDATLDVAMRVRPKLQDAGFRTVMTRADDAFVPLTTRANISNRQGNVVFVSIHFNYSPRSHIRGAEVYYHSRCSAELARNILNQVAAIPGASSRGIRIANFCVLRRNDYPAVLVECGYLTNPYEGRRCGSGVFREQLSEAITRGLVIQRYGGATMIAAQ